MGFGWKIMKNVLFVIKALFSRWAAFFGNLIIFMIPIYLSTGFSIKENVIVSVVVYSFFFELLYNLFLKKKIKKVHEMIDCVVYSINNNFKES